MVSFFDSVHSLGGNHAEVSFSPQEMEDQFAGDLVVAKLFLDAVNRDVFRVDMN